jgi:hypothetical protein
MMIYTPLEGCASSNCAPVNETTLSLNAWLLTAALHALASCFEWMDGVEAQVTTVSLPWPRQVYRAACHYSDSEHETDIALRITSSRAFNRIMLFTLREARSIWRVCNY